MGLDFSHCDAHWSYSGFNRFRERLAESININLSNMYGFGGTDSWYGLNDDIVPLLNHSDCDGKLTIRECRKVSKRLRELVVTWDDNDYDKMQALRLADGMDLAVKEKKQLIFC